MMINHPSHRALHVVYKSLEIVGSAGIQTVKAYPCTTGAVAIGVIAICYLSQRHNLKEELRTAFDSFKFAVRQIVC